MRLQNTNQSQERDRSYRSNSRAKPAKLNTRDFRLSCVCFLVFYGEDTVLSVERSLEASGRMTAGSGRVRLQFPVQLKISEHSNSWRYRVIKQSPSAAVADSQRDDRSMNE